LHSDEVLVNVVHSDTYRHFKWCINEELLRFTSDYFGQVIAAGKGSHNDPIYLHVEDQATWHRLAIWIRHKTLDTQMPLRELQKLFFAAEEIQSIELMDRVIDEIRETTKADLFYIHKHGHTIHKVYEKTSPDSRLRELCVEQVVGKFVVDSEQLGGEDWEGVMIGPETLPGVHEICKDNVELFTDFLMVLQSVVEKNGNNHFRIWETHPDTDCRFHSHTAPSDGCYR
jgi:hypothetical protein